MGPNAVCRNSACRKPFVSCLYCAKTANWRGICCSFDCYNAYAAEVEAARAKGRALSLLPDRSDMPEGEVAKVLAKPLADVAEFSRNELAEVSDVVAESGFAAAVDVANKKVRVSRKKKVAVEDSRDGASQDPGRMISAPTDVDMIIIDGVVIDEG